MNVNATTRTTLACTAAEITIAGARIESRAGWYAMREAATLTWTVEVEAPGQYGVGIAYSLADNAAPYQLLVDDSVSGEGVLARTDGYFGDQQPLKNFTLFEHPSPLVLRGAVLRVSIRIEAEGEPPPLGFCELRLTPESALAALAEEEGRAVAARADVNWLQNSGYGLMVHWTSQTQPRRGALKPYAEAVADFDVAAFAETVRATGAAYVIFTANHAQPTFPGPLKEWEGVYPGWTTARDLVDEMIEALAAHGIKFLLYLNLFVAHRDFGGADCTQDFLATSCRLLEEIGERYGERLPGYWIDSWHEAFGRFGSIPMEPVFRAAKAGNPGRLSCFNWGIRPIGTPWQEYWSGETVTPGDLPADPASGRLLSGAGQGLNGHALLIMDDFWVHKEPDTDIAAPRLSSNELVDFIQDCKAKKAPVSINLAIYQDGSIAPATAEIMNNVKRGLR